MERSHRKMPAASSQNTACSTPEADRVFRSSLRAVSSMVCFAGTSTTRFLMPSAVAEPPTVEAPYVT